MIYLNVDPNPASGNMIKMFLLMMMSVTIVIVTWSGPGDHTSSSGVSGAQLG